LRWQVFWIIGHICWPYYHVPVYSIHQFKAQLDSRWVLVASLLSLLLTTIHPLEARPLFYLSSRSSARLTAIFGSSMCTTTRLRLGSSSTPSARSCSPSLMVKTVVRLFSHSTVSTAAQIKKLQRRLYQRCLERSWL
jgi:hypothetical protein